MTDSFTDDAPEGIAIIGMSGRFPGARDLDAFWQNLRDGVESITFFRNEELEPSIVLPDDLDAPNFVKAGPILDDVDRFDASFFGYTPRDAEILDPQQRLFLECAWEALEHAGYDSEQHQGWIGVYGGLGLPSYLLNNLYQNQEIRTLMATGLSLQVSTANNVDYLATRVSYKMNLRGPSISLQTACSTSLVAVHLAAQALLSYQCDMALAGGVSIRVPQYDGYWYQEGGIVSPDGHCRSFDARAQGTVFGSGAGIVVLKRLSEALADGDQVYAVIRGSAINNDGAQKVGFTAPGVEGQASVIAMAQSTAGVDPETISYIEAHGTATPVGDPIEIAALTQVFRAKTQRQQFCAIGSVKANIGHANTAAGIAGLIKTVLSLQNRQIPPSLNFETPNPKIDFASSPFYVNTTLSEWPSNGAPRRAGVSSFGVGGTNAHLVIEEAPPLEPSGPSRPYQLLTLSARTETALETMTADLVAHLKRNPELPLADVAFTLQTGRRAFNHRRTLVCRDRDDAIAALEAVDPQRVETGFREQRDRAIVFMFSGQGAQYVNMARDLYRAESVFREQVDRCCDVLLPHLGLDLRDLLYPDERRTTNDGRDTETGRHGDRETGRHRDREIRNKTNTQSSVLSPQSSFPITQLDQTQYTQPALFVIEYALAQLWMAWGVQPQALIGHSIGEYVAACLAGVFSLDDALALVAARGRLMQHLPAGAMLMVPLSEQELLPHLDDQLSLAAINAPARSVVAGPEEAVAALERRLVAVGIECRRLHTSHAFHSRMMEPILEPFLQEVQRVTLRTPSIPYISNVTGTWITAEEATDPHYWARHLRQAVRFADGVTELLREPARVFLEVGPGQTLTTFARQHPDRAAGQLVLASLRHPKDQQSDVAFALGGLGQLWLAGLRVNWAAVYAHERRRRVALPTYPFERQRYWIDASKAFDGIMSRSGSLNKKPDIADWFYIPSWRRSIPPVFEPGTLDAQPARWLVFEDAEGLGARLAQQLAQAGHEVVRVAIGAEFGCSGERAFTLDPSQPEHYNALFAELNAAQAVPQMIVHLWGVEALDPALPRDAVFERAQTRSFYSLLFLAQAIGKQNITEPLQIGIISNAMQSVAGEAYLRPEQALLLGPCKVIPQEYPNIGCRSIDVVLPAPDSLAARDLADQLIAELAAPSADPIVAYRGFDRWVQTYEAVRLGAAIAEQTRVREGGVYLITGGLGGIGLVLAEELAETARAKLVLVGRSAFLDRAEWDAWLASHSEQDGMSARIRAVQKLEALGAEVLVVSADVADKQAMRDVVRRARQQFGALHGVIHSAGIAGGGMIQLKTPDMAARVLGPKLGAMQALEAALDDVELDFLVLCSSTTAIIGGMGQVDYCAANAFLDAYARAYAARRGIFSVSINWDVWQEVGMAVNVAASYGLLEAPAARGKELAHPLLDVRIQEAPNHTIYCSEFDGSSLWVLAEHKIMGVPALPGTAYLEIARAAFEAHTGATTAELHDVFFMTPLMVGADERKEVRTILEGEGDTFNFRVLSRLVSKDGGQPAWQEHARGKIARLEPAGLRQHDIDDLIAACGVESIAVTESAVKGAEKFVYWGPRWMSLKRAHVAANQALAVLELPEAFASDLSAYVLHPALLDVATAFGHGLVGSEESYLPLSYGRLRVHAPLTGKLYSYVRYTGDAISKGDAASKKETISFDITIVDDLGLELVEIEDFTMRRVGESATRLRESAAREQHDQIHAGNGLEQPHERRNGSAPAAAPMRERPAMTGILSREGVEAFRRILLQKRLSQVVVSTKDLYAAIERSNTLKQSRILEEIDKAQRTRPAHPRPDMRTRYVVPNSAAEHLLAGIWQQVLGIDQVGIHDNFFELGGDSVLAVQIIAKASESDIQLTPAQLFQYQTIADLAAVIDVAQLPAAESGQVSGPLPLTPIQRRFFEQEPVDPQLRSQEVVLETSVPLDPALIERAVRQLLVHHDALRLRFVRDETGWEQTSAESEEHLLFFSRDLSSLPEEEQAAAVDAIAAEVRASLRLDEGPIMGGAYLECGYGRPARLLLVVHQLAADAATWRMLLEDLWTAYDQLSRGEAVELPARTASFKRWAERLAEHARSDALVAERSYWLSMPWERAERLPLDAPAGAEAAAGAATDVVTTALSVEETDELLNAALQTYSTHVDELLLTALVDACDSWTGARRLLVHLEHDSREGVFNDLDLARTAGWCSARFPLLLDLDDADAPGAALKTVKEQLRAVPRHGIGYEALLYLDDDAATAAQLRSLPPADLSFVYHGRADERLPDASPLRAAYGPRRAGHGSPGGYALAISASVAGGQLLIEWAFGERFLLRPTVEQLADDFMAALRALIDHCLTTDADGFTLADFPDVDLSQEDLDRLMARIGR